MLVNLIHWMLHLDQYLSLFVLHYGAWLYVLLFLVIFCETGLVVTPFLPGDSLLFATGVLVAQSPEAFNIHKLFILLFSASFLGNSLNYGLGKWVGPKIFYSGQSVFFNRAYLEKAHLFYERYGAKTIVIARFMPIIRTFAPFVAGIATMRFRDFSAYNAFGALLWVGGLLYTSYWFGQVPFVKGHFSTIILSIVVISLLPLAIELLRKVLRQNANRARNV